MNKAILICLCLFLFYSCQDHSYRFELTERNTPGESSLRAICALDEHIVWASGSQGQVFRTTDGGLNWKQMTIPGCEESEFRSLHAWDSSRALVFDISPLGRGFMTTDGGASWEQVYQSPVEGAFFNSLKFAGELQGIAISDPVDDRVFMLKTEDGGRNWKRMDTTPQVVRGEINFAASNTCIEYLESGEIFIVTGGSNSRVLTSRDHGTSWTCTQTDMIRGPSAGLFSISFTGRRTGVALGGDYNHTKRQGVRAIYTVDGGKTWKASETMPAAYRSCVVALNRDLLFATGKSGCDYSTDGGKNWIFIDSTGSYAASAVRDKNMLFLAGSEGRVARVEVHAQKKSGR